MSAWKIAMLGLAIGSPVLAGDDLQPWGEAGRWAVLVDPAYGNGCLIQTAFPDGSNLRLGFDPTTNRSYLSSYGPAWDGVAQVGSFPVSYRLGTKDFQGQADGVQLGATPGAQVFFDEAGFLDLIVQQAAMSVSVQGAVVATIDLTGSGPALREALECQQEQG